MLFRSRVSTPVPQLPGVLTRLRADLFSYLRHVQWLRRAGGPSLRTLEPDLGALQARLDRLLRRLQLLVRSPGSETPGPQTPGLLQDPHPVSLRPQTPKSCLETLNSHPETRKPHGLVTPRLPS